MNLQPITGEKGRYIVPASDKRHSGEAYIVETGARPSCNCTDFTARRLAKLREDGKVIAHGKDRNVCKHIACALALEKHLWLLGRKYDGVEIRTIGVVWEEEQTDIVLNDSAQYYKQRIIIDE